jgi:RNA polymerase sigma-70 factor, ECF subfamily
MYFRKNKRRLRSEQLSENGEMPAPGAAGNKPTNLVDRILLSEVIAKLPDGYREAVILHDIHGLEHKEIARRKGRTEGTSKSQLHKARVTLRALITQPAPAQPVQA